MIAILLAMLPVVGQIIPAFVSAFYNAKVSIKTAQIGGDTAVAQSLVAAQVSLAQSQVNRLQVISSSWVLSFLVVGFALPWIAYEWKAVLIDNVINNGATSTPAIHGQVADWANTIIWCLFGSGTAATIGHMYFNRKDQ